MSDVDVIVLDLDGGELLESCLASIQRQTLPPRRVIVFDNGSSVPVAARLPLALAAGVRVIRSEHNLGFTGGVNEAVREAGEEYLALINNDVELDRHWLAVLVAAMDAHPRAGGMQTILRRDAETIDGAGIDIRDGTFRQLGHGLPLGSALPEAWGISATAALYRRAAVGPRPFDPRFFAYYEDVELCARLHDTGWQTGVLPIAAALHHGSRSAPRLGRRAVYLRTRNRYLVARMHPGVGRIGALLREDVRLLLQGRTSLRGMVAGLI
jgi:GT2 family glycosyltransferase